MGVNRSHSGGWSVLALGLGVMSCMTVLSQAVPTDRLSKRFETNWGTNNTFSSHEGCVAGSKSYKSGETVTENAGPCEECVCKPPNIQCTMVHCPVKTGCKIIQLPNQCCPQFQCDCEFNGKNYFNGEQIETQLDKPCEVCYCKGGDIMCTSVTCYERSDCQAKVVPGQCCPKYENCPPRGVKELGHSDKTEGSIDIDSKTKKREMQPWLLTNPAEEVERHETTEINAPTGHDENFSALTTQEGMAVTQEGISSNYSDNPSTEYRLLVDNSTYEITERGFSVLSLDDEGKMTSVSYNSDATEAYETSTPLAKNESGDVLRLETNKLSTDKNSNPGIVITNTPIRFEKITGAQRTEVTTDSFVASISEQTTEQATQLTDHSEEQGYFKSILESEKKISETASKDFDQNIKDSYTTPLAVAELEAATLETERMKQEANNPPSTQTDISKTVDSTVQPYSVINQDFKALIEAVNNDEADTNFGQKENTADSISSNNNYMISTTNASPEEKVSYTTINNDLKLAEEQVAEQELKSEVTSHIDTPLVTTAQTETDKYKVFLTIGQIEEKATIENVNAFVEQDMKESERTEASIESTTYLEGLSTVLNERLEVTTPVDIDEAATYAASETIQKTQDKLEEDTGRILSTTGPEVSTKLISGKSSTNVYLSNPERETELKKDEKIVEDLKQFSTEEMLYSTQQPLNDHRTELSILSTQKILDESVKSEKTEEGSPTTSQTIEAIEVDKSEINEQKKDANADSTSDPQLLTTTDQLVNQKYQVTTVGKIEESTDAEHTTFRSDEKIQNYDALGASSTYADITTESETFIIDNVFKLVVSSALSPENLGDRLNDSAAVQHSESTTVENLGPEKEITPTTDTTYTTIREKIQSFDKNTFLSAQLSPDQNEMENLASKSEKKPTDVTTNSEFLTTYESAKISDTVHPTDLIGYLKQQSAGGNSNNSNLNESSTEPYKKLDASSTLPTEEYPLTEDPKLVQSILNLALSMQTPNDNTVGIPPPSFIPIKYIGQSEETQNTSHKITEINGSTTPFDKKTFSTFFTEKTEGTTENFGDTKQVEQLISKHMQNLTQIALAPVANKLLNLVNKGNKTDTKKGSATQNVKDDIIMPKDSEIERIAEEIRNATIQSFKDSFETLEEQLGDEPVSTTKAPKLTSQPVKHKAESAQSNSHKVRRRRNKIKTKK